MEKYELNQDEIVEVNDFDFDGFEVVRGEYFAHLREPGLTFANNKLFVNSACLSKRPDTDYIQILVNAEEKKLIVKPCQEEEKDSFRWATSGTRRGPRQITCKVFYAKVFTLMAWDPDFRYKLIGKLVKIDSQLMFVFDLNTPSIYVRLKGDPGKIKFSRSAKYPEEWKNQFGVPGKIFSM